MSSLSPLCQLLACRISTTHSSFMNYLLTLTHERYSVLASWPDFTKAVSGSLAGKGVAQGFRAGGPGALREAPSGHHAASAELLRRWLT